MEGFIVAVRRPKRRSSATEKAAARKRQARAGKKAAVADAVKKAEDNPDEAKPIDWSKPQAVSMVQRAFPADIVGKKLPHIEEIPEAFRAVAHIGKYRHEAATDEARDWCRKVMHGLFFGGFLKPGFVPREGIDAETAFIHLDTCLRSFQPKHEHKEAGCAWLASLWFKDIIEMDGMDKSK